MFRLFFARSAPRRVAMCFPKAAVLPRFKYSLNTQTRSFMLSSSLRAESNKAKAGKPKKKPTRKAKPATSRSKAKSKKVVKKKTVSRAVSKEPKKVILPLSFKVPKSGPTDFSHYYSKYYLPGQPPLLRENIGTVSKAAAAAWSDLSAGEKEEIRAEAVKLRGEAKEKRHAFLRTADPSLLKELNRRRMKYGARRIKVYKPPSERRPSNSYIRFVVEQLKDHGSDGLSAKDFTKKLGLLWKTMSEAQKAPYVSQAKAEFAEWKAKQKK